MSLMKILFQMMEDPIYKIQLCMMHNMMQKDTTIALSKNGALKIFSLHSYYAFSFKQDLVYLTIYIKSTLSMIEIELSIVTYLIQWGTHGFIITIIVIKNTS